MYLLHSTEDYIVNIVTGVLIEEVPQNCSTATATTTAYVLDSIFSPFHSYRVGYARGTEHSIVLEDDCRVREPSGSW
jgi:hypothetical protein